MEKPDLIAELTELGEALGVFLIAGGGILIALYLHAWHLIVLVLILGMIVLIHLYFKEKKSKGYILYIFASFLVLGILSFAGIYQGLGIVDSTTNEKITEYSTALYFSVVTWTTLGYGDFKPTPEARFYAAAQAMIGYIYMALLVAKFFQWANMVTRKIKSETE